MFHQHGKLLFKFSAGTRVFLFSTASTLALGPT